MDPDNKKAFTDLRDTVLEELSPVLMSGDMTPESKFTIQLSAAQASGQIEKYREALESIRQFSDDTSKANAYMDLMEAIDVQLGDISTADNTIEQESQHPEGELA